MNVVFAWVFAAVIVAAAAAPTITALYPEVPQYIISNQLPEYIRDRRSQYASPYASYASPCAAAQIPLSPAAYQLNGILPGHGGYGGIGAGIPTSYGHAGYSGGYGVPHYRSDEHEDAETLQFSDMDHGMSEHMPQARYGSYAAAPAPAYGAPHIGGGLSALSGYDGHIAPAAPAPAFGVFPNANVGGCNVPLLFSCSPSIVAGKLLKSHGYGGAAIGGGEAYRGADEHTTHDAHEEHHDEQASHDHATPVHETSHSTTA